MKNKGEILLFIISVVIVLTALFLGYNYIDLTELRSVITPYVSTMIVLTIVTGIIVCKKKEPLIFFVSTDGSKDELECVRKYAMTKYKDYKVSLATDIKKLESCSFVFICVGKNVPMDQYRVINEITKTKKRVLVLKISDDAMIPEELMKYKYLLAVKNVNYGSK